jgi:hypothetical protein
VSSIKDYIVSNAKGEKRNKEEQGFIVPQKNKRA